MGVEAAILVGRTQRDTAVAEGPADLEWPIAEAQPAIAVDPAYDRPGAIVERLDLLGKAAPARAIARRRGGQRQGLVRPLGVVQSNEITPIRSRSLRSSTRGIRGSDGLFMSMR